VREQLVHREHVVQAGHIVQRARAFGKDGRSHERQRRILGAAHLHLPAQGLASANQYLVHACILIQ